MAITVTTQPVTIAGITTTQINVTVPPTAAVVNGVPAGGLTGQALVKVDGTNYNTEWADPAGSGVVVEIIAGTNVTVDNTDPARPVVAATGGGGGAVDSVNGETGVVVLDYADVGAAPALGTDDNYVTDAEKIVIGNTSGTNTGDQDLSGYSLTSHNHTGVYAPVLGADDNYVTDAEKIVIGNTSGTNTGDQDLSGYSLTSHNHTGVYAPVLGTDDNYVTDAEKIVIGNTSGTNTGDQDLSGKQELLVSGTNIKTVNSTSLLGSGDVAVQETLVSGTNIKTINSVSLLGSGDITISGGAARSINKMAIAETDFFVSETSQGLFYGAASASGTSPQIDAEVNHPGITAIRTSTTTNSGYLWKTRPTALVIGGGETFDCIFKVVISTDSTAYIGLHDSSSQLEPTDGVYFKITGATVEAKTAANGSYTTGGTTYDVSDNTWYHANITLNADATSATLILYSEAGAVLLTQTITTNIPTTSTYYTGAGFVATSTGTSARNIYYLDYMRLENDRELTRG